MKDPLTDQEIEKLVNAAEDAARSHKGDDLPSKTSAVLDRSTGEIYKDFSRFNKASLQPPKIADTLRTAMSPKSLETWRTTNCAEFNAVNNALLDGAKPENLVVRTIFSDTLKNAPPCKNCIVFERNLDLAVYQGPSTLQIAEGQTSEKPDGHEQDVHDHDHNHDEKPAPNEEPKVGPETKAQVETVPKTQVETIPKPTGTPAPAANNYSDFSLNVKPPEARATSTAESTGPTKATELDTAETTANSTQTQTTTAKSTTTNASGPTETTATNSTTGTSQTSGTSEPKGMTQTVAKAVGEESNLIRGAGKTLTAFNRVAGPIGLAVAAVSTGVEVYDDLKKGDNVGAVEATAGFGGGLVAAGAGFEGGAALGALTGPAAPVAIPVLGAVGATVGYFGGDALAREAVHETAQAVDAFAKTQIGQDTIQIGKDGGTLISDAAKDVVNSAAGRFISDTTSAVVNSAPVQGGIHAVEEAGHFISDTTSAVVNSAPVQGGIHAVEEAGHFISDTTSAVVNSAPVQGGIHAVEEAGHFISDTTSDVANSAPVQGGIHAVEEAGHFISDTTSDVVNSAPVQGGIKAVQVGIRQTVEAGGQVLELGEHLIDQTSQTELGKHIVAAGEGVDKKVHDVAHQVVDSLEQTQLGRDALQLGNDTAKLGSDAVQGTQNAAHNLYNWLTGQQDPQQTPQDDSERVATIHEGLTQHFKNNPGLNDIAQDYHQRVAEANDNHSTRLELGMELQQAHDARTGEIKQAQNTAREDIQSRQSTLASVSNFHSETQNQSQHASMTV